MRIRIAVLFVLVIAFAVIMVSARRDKVGTALRNECIMSCVMKAGKKSHEAMKQCSNICHSIPKDSTMYDQVFNEDYGYDNEDEDDDENEVESDSMNGSLINQEELWDMYRVEVLRAITKGNLQNRPYLQLLTSPIDAVWDTENPNLLQILANTVPYWSDYYDPSPFTISSQYRSFVNNINAGRVVKDSGSKALADQYQREFEEASNRMLPAQMACWDRYAQQQPAGMTVDQFEQTRCPELQSLRNEVNEKNSMFIFFITLAYGPEHQTLLESRSAAGSGMSYREAGGTTLKAFRSALARGVRSPLQVSVTGFSQMNRSKKFSEVSTGLTRPSRLNGSQFQFLTTGGANGLSTRRDKFSLNIKFESYAAIRIAPDAWFRESLFQKYGAGPFINRQSPLFGTSGTMRLRPSIVYVVYRPRFEMLLDKSDAFNFMNAVTKSSGGFFSSKRESSSIKTEIVNQDTVKVIMQSNSDVPQIIAIDNDFLG